MSKTKAEPTKKSKPINAAFMKPVQPDAILGAIVGNDPLPRTEIMKRLWAEIKAKKMQDPGDKKKILALTPEFKAFFNGAPSAGMFQLATLANARLVK